MGRIGDFIGSKKAKKLVAEVENKDDKEEVRKKINEIIKKYPELLDEVVNTAKESDQIEDEVIIEILIKNIETIVDKKEISEKEKTLLNLGVKVLAAIGKEIPDKYLDKLADAARKSRHIDRQTEINVIKQMGDKKSKQKQVAKSLRRIHAGINEKTTDAYIQSVIGEFEGIVESSKSIKDLKRDIIAKKIAYNYMNNKSTQLYSLTKIISIDEMFMINMPEIVQNQYNEIMKKEKKNNSEKKYHKYDKQKFRMELLNQMAKDAAYKYKETGELKISQSQQMKKITAEEEEFFINKIDILTNKKLDERQIILIKAKIRGNLEELINLEEVTSIINKLPIDERNQAINQMRNIAENKELRKIIRTIQKVGLDKSFKGMDESSIEKRMKVFKETVDAQKEKKDKEEQTQSAHLGVTDDNEEVSL